jgi:hypothetical protein
MIRHPVAGNMLAYFQYLLGFLRLGHQVFYLEESGWPGSCYNPESGCHGDDPVYGIRAVQALMQRYNIDIPVCYVNRDTGDIKGIDPSGLQRALSSADLLLNVGGVCSLPEFSLAPRRVLIDMDPLFTQLGYFTASEELENYDLHFSYGTNIGQPGCTVPTCGLDWLATVPPVVPDIWQNIAAEDRRDRAGASFTTICNWSAYGSIVHEGEHYGQKDEEFLRLLELPGYVSRPLELALAGAEMDAQHQLRAAGWVIREAAEISNDLLSYQAYLARSYAEFSVAKHAYVKTRSGWFSDRSACYLAAGRPVVVQDTGAGDWLNTGHGVMTFSNMDQAIACIQQLESDYDRHRADARDIAEQVFSYRVVLPSILERAFATKRDPAFTGH